MVKHYWNRYEKVVEFAPPQKKKYCGHPDDPSDVQNLTIRHEFHMM